MARYLKVEGVFPVEELKRMVKDKSVSFSLGETNLIFYTDDSKYETITFHFDDLRIDGMALDEESTVGAIKILSEIEHEIKS